MVKIPFLSKIIENKWKWIESEPDRKIQKKEKRKKARQNRTGPYTRVYDHELSSNENFDQFLHVGIDFGLNHKMTEDEMKGKFELTGCRTNSENLGPGTPERVPWA